VTPSDRTWAPRGAVTAPWTPDQVQALQRWQTNTEVVHPYTSLAGTPLIPTSDGWVEHLDGPVIQSWADPFAMHTPATVRGWPRIGRWVGRLMCGLKVHHYEPTRSDRVLAYVGEDGYRDPSDPSRPVPYGHALVVANPTVCVRCGDPRDRRFERVIVPESA